MEVMDVRNVSTDDLQASSDLLFCPFCGGEAAFHERERVGVECIECGAGFACVYRDRDEAAEEWNRRAERTCRDNGYMQDAIHCSECGEITLNTLYWVESSDGLMTVKRHRPRFCSNCGARVVDA